MPCYGSDRALGSKHLDWSETKDDIRVLQTVESRMYGAVMALVPKQVMPNLRDFSRNDEQDEQAKIHQPSN